LYFLDAAARPERYDAVVIEPDRATASVFRGLRRRDPLLVHRGRDKAEGKHVTDIVGTLSGGGPLETGDHVVVAFFSPEASAMDLPAAQPLRDRSGKRAQIRQGPRRESCLKYFG